MARETWNDPLAGSPGKRLRSSDPLTEHDAAERLDKSALRTVRILSDLRQLGLMDLVKHSRYLTNSLGMLAAELQLWGAEPQEGYAQEYPGPEPGQPPAPTPGRRMTDEERIEARHWLQVLSERARSVRDAMDPRHGILAVTDGAWAGQWETLRHDLDVFTDRVRRGASSPGGLRDRNA